MVTCAMVSALGLELFGDPIPLSEQELAAAVSGLVGPVHPDVVALLRGFGPGSICALFEVPDPRGGSWEGLRRRFELHREHGFWPGLAPSDAERLVVFATDARGAALGCTEERLWLLAADGGVFDCGSSLAELVEMVLCPSIGRTYATALDAPGRYRRPDDGRHLDLGCQAVFVAAGTPGVDAYLAALRTGADADGLLEGAMVEQPLLLSHRALLARLCAPAADNLPGEARTEAIALVTRIAIRREPSFATLLPASFRPETAARDPEVRAWAACPPELSPRGPYALADPAPTPRPIRVEAPLGMDPGFAAVDPDLWIETHAEALRGMDATLAAALEDAALALARSESAGFVRQIAQLDEQSFQLTRGTNGIVWEADPAARARAAAGRLAKRRDEAWPLLALAVAAASPGTVRAWAAQLLSGFQHALMPRLWLHAIVSTEAPTPFGADPWTLAQRLAATSPMDDALLSACLPALRLGSGVAALVLIRRVDREDVRRALLDVLPQVICLRGWEGEPHDRDALETVDELAREALRPIAGMPPSPPGSTATAGVGPGAPRDAVAGPWVKGPLAPITRALIGVSDKRVVDRLRAIARDKRTNLQARTEAARGLVALRAPDVDTVVELVEQAWERYWRI